MFDEFFTEDNWMNWSNEMDFLKQKIRDRMEERKWQVRSIINDYEDAALEQKEAEQI